MKFMMFNFVDGIAGVIVGSDVSLILGKEDKHMCSFGKPSVVWLTGYTAPTSQLF